jgi:alpha/beta superfamily hydrolase
MMHYKVVYRAAKALQSAGLAVLRFNFRGVGRSQGVHDGGRGEQEDVRAAADWMARGYPALPLVLGGFSFGADMALRVGVGDARVRALFALGFPLSMSADDAFLDGCVKPRLFGQGENDEFGPGEAIRAFVERLPEPREFALIPGADHYFGGQLDALQHRVADWAARRPWEGR